MPRRNHHRPLRASTAVGGTVRIIAGQWRGRTLRFPETAEVRPTPDRVRETLFNWLQGYLPGARCLDLFSGSGALGIEALSRGAASVTFVERDAEVVNRLQTNINLLKAQNAEVIAASALDWLDRRQPDQEVRYDLVFMDPPFHQGLVAPICELLERRGLLREEAMIYIETERSLSLDTLPGNWTLHREKTAGQVAYRLFARQAGE
jgi:16S rRNA (guanine966-N2)-methyltransferase